MKNKIKEIIKERGISQKQLCEMTGMSEAGMSNAINGSASQETLQKVAQALSLEVEDLTDVKLYAKFSADKTPLKLGEVEIPCYVLNNGMRVFSGRGIQRAIGAGAKSSGQWLSGFVKDESVSSYLPLGVLDKFNNPVEFKRKDAGGSQTMTYGYEATLLIDLCNAIIDAYNDQRPSVTKEYYNCANIILRAVAKVGIIALVDEATGYNKEKTRAKDELQRFLSEFINQEASRWIKTFDDTFFEDIYKMRNWTWEKTVKKPSFVGKIINDIVYERIAPMVLAELRKLNPKSDSGTRRYKFHQFLTSDIGRPTLQQHLAVLHSFALVSDYNWDKFMRMLDKAHPKQYQQLALFDDIEIE
jgi:transcriptional regulator with XRE-family HTH domain